MTAVFCAACGCVVVWMCSGGVAGVALGRASVEGVREWCDFVVIWRADGTQMTVLGSVFRPAYFGCVYVSHCRDQHIPGLVTGLVLRIVDYTPYRVPGHNEAAPTALVSCQFQCKSRFGLFLI